MFTRTTGCSTVTAISQHYLTSTIPVVLPDSLLEQTHVVFNSLVSVDYWLERNILQGHQSLSGMSVYSQHNSSEETILHNDASTKVLFGFSLPTCFNYLNDLIHVMHSGSRESQQKEENGKSTLHRRCFNCNKTTTHTAAQCRQQNRAPFTSNPTAMNRTPLACNQQFPQEINWNVPACAAPSFNWNVPQQMWHPAQFPIFRQSTRQVEIAPNSAQQVAICEEYLLSKSLAQLRI